MYFECANCNSAILDSLGRYKKVLHTPDGAAFRLRFEARIAW
jgi:hypothetical protein